MQAFYIFVIYAFIQRSDGCQWDKSPPGPERSPIVGNLFQLAPDQTQTYVQWAELHGDIIRVDLADAKSIVISDPKLIKEMFDSDINQGRPDFSLFDFANDGNVYGVLNTEGNAWNEMRHFSIKHLHEIGKSFGWNKWSSGEEIIMKDVQEFVNNLQKQNGVPIGGIKQRFWTAMGNSLIGIMTGQRFDSHDDAQLAQITNNSMAFKAAVEKGSIFLVAPIIAKVLPEQSGFSMLRKIADNFGDSLKPLIKENKEETKNPNNGNSSFVDMFYKLAANSKEGSPFHGEIGENHLHGMMGDLYFAGSDTVSSTLSFLTLYLSKHPEVLGKIQNEISTVIGNGDVHLKDRERLPYTQSVILETLRLSSIVPQGVAHQTTESQNFHGYSIPKGTSVTPNLFKIHHDPKFWSSPESFIPERFNGTEAKHSEAFLPFSTGYRKCVGEVVAQNALFLYVANIFKRFNVQLEQNPDSKGDEGMTQFSFITYPKEFRVSFIEKK